MKGQIFQLLLIVLTKKLKKEFKLKDHPLSFGPRSEQDIYYFIDFFCEKKIDIYKIYEITNSQIDNTMVIKKKLFSKKQGFQAKGQDLI